MGLIANYATAILAIFPAMPERPEAISAAFGWLYGLNYFVPVGELIHFLYQYLGVYVGVLLLIRIYRLIPVVGGR